ncbi:MAG: DNA repair protein [Arenimonas sp.]|jgi:uncharacterized protein (DUF488 family)|nr:DNA repair protein [Arenimonas sp.]
MADQETLPFFTIGHSTRTIEEFAGLLRAADVELVADIRTVPRSRTNPQFNADSLPQSLAPFGIGYELIPALGGLRGKARTIAPEVNGFWENRSFHNYADHALSDAFDEGLGRLVELGRANRCAMMCSEAVWWRCHRRIVADYLLARGENVLHLMGKDRIEPAKMTPGARAMPDGTVTYPAS